MDNTARVKEGKCPAYSQLLTKSDPLAEANSTALTETSFIELRRRL